MKLDHLCDVYFRQSGPDSGLQPPPVPEVVHHLEPRRIGGTAGEQGGRAWSKGARHRGGVGGVGGGHEGGRDRLYSSGSRIPATARHKLHRPKQRGPASEATPGQTQDGTPSTSQGRPTRAAAFQKTLPRASGEKVSSSPQETAEGFSIR